MRFAAQVIRQCGFGAWGFARRFIFDVRKSGNAGLCACGLALGGRFWRVELVRRKNGGAVEATMLGGKTLTAQLARRENDAGGG